MAEELRTLPELLCHVGNELANSSESLLVLQRSCHAEAESAQSGWIGSSAITLSGLLDRWMAASTAHISHLGDHAAGMRAAGAGFTQMEQCNAATLARKGQPAQ